MGYVDDGSRGVSVIKQRKGYKKPGKDGSMNAPYIELVSFFTFY